MREAAPLSGTGHNALVGLLSAAGLSPQIGR